MGFWHNTAGGQQVLGPLGEACLANTLGYCVSASHRLSSYALKLCLATFAVSPAFPLGLEML
jgi:hypothetical protein